MRGIWLLQVIVLIAGCSAHPVPSPPEPTRVQIAPAPERPQRGPEKKVTSASVRVNLKRINDRLDKATKAVDRAHKTNEHRSYILDTRDEKELR